MDTAINLASDKTRLTAERHYSVLIVDDSDEDRYLLKRYLKRSDLSLVILEASSGREGLSILTSPIEELQNQHVSLEAPMTVFLDINMPLMNGWEFVVELENRQAEVALKPTVVIMYSTAESEYESHKVEDYETIVGYIVKGRASPADLKQAIVNATHPD